MALTPDPPPLYADPPAASPTTPSGTTGADTITTYTNGPGYDILGRDGAPPDAVYADIIQTLANQYPTAAPNGSWWGDWGGFYLGTGGGRHPQPPIILFEIRTAAEVIVAAGALRPGETPFAASVFNAGLAATATLPAADGGSWFNSGNAPYDPDTDRIFHRILIRDDLLTGGAGTRFAGEAFFRETCMHEVGHLIAAMIATLYGDDYLRTNVCGFFGRPTSAWDDHDLPWGDRVEEAAAEFYKDMVLPSREYDNRTNLDLPEARFGDFKQLYVDYFENPYWDYENREAPNWQASTFLSEAGYVQVTQQRSHVWVPDLATLPHGTGGNIGTWRALRWPHVGDTPRFHFNFHPEDDSWIDDFAADTSDPVVAATFLGKIHVGFSWQPLGNWGALLSEIEPPLRNDIYEVNPESEPDGKGLVTADLSGLPDEGFVMQTGFGDFTPTPEWIHPRPDADTHVDPARLPLAAYDPYPAAKADRRPWWEWSGIRRARYAIRDIPWPYVLVLDRPGIVQASGFGVGVVRV